MNSINPDINPVKSFFKSIEKKLLHHSKHLYFKTVSHRSPGAKNIIRNTKEQILERIPLARHAPSGYAGGKEKRHMPVSLKSATPLQNIMQANILSY